MVFGLIFRKRSIEDDVSFLFIRPVDLGVSREGEKQNETSDSLSERNDVDRTNFLFLIALVSLFVVRLILFSVEKNKTD